VQRVKAGDAALDSFLGVASNNTEVSP